MQFAKGYKTPISPQNVRLRNCRLVADLVGISEHEFSSFEREFLRITARNAASLNCGMTDAIPKAEWLLLIGGGMTILPPYGGDSRQLPVCFPGAIERGFETLAIRRNRGEHYVDL